MEWEFSSFSQILWKVWPKLKEQFSLAMAKQIVENVRSAFKQLGQTIWEEWQRINTFADSFDRLSKQAGLSSNDLLNTLKTASRGMISEADLMASANKAMLLWVSGSLEDFSTLMQIAEVKGKAMGESTTDAFNDIVVGIGRASPQILDNLWIVLDANTAYKKYAESIWKSSDELTKAEKQQALLKSIVWSSVDDLEAYSNEVLNFNQVWSQTTTAFRDELWGIWNWFITEVVQPVVEWFNQMLGISVETSYTLTKLRQEQNSLASEMWSLRLEYERGIITFEEYQKRVLEIWEEENKLRKKIAEEEEEVRKNRETTKELQEQYDATTQAIEIQSKTIAWLQKRISSWQNDFYDLWKQLEYVEAQLNKNIEKQQVLWLAMKYATSLWEEEAKTFVAQNIPAFQKYDSLMQQLTEAKDLYNNTQVDDSGTRSDWEKSRQQALKNIEAYMALLQSLVALWWGVKNSRGMQLGLKYAKWGEKSNLSKILWINPEELARATDALSEVTKKYNEVKNSIFEEKDTSKWKWGGGWKSAAVKQAEEEAKRIKELEKEW